MNKYLDEYLCKKYPKIFADRNKPMTETCMCWGFDHDNGWFFLIDTLCSSIQHHIDNPPWVYKKTFKVRMKRIWDFIVRKLHMPTRFYCDMKDMMELEVIPQVVALQVKSKFSSLRFYYYGGDEEIRGMVSLAESLSYKICEECGRMDENVGRNVHGWITTSCKDHAENVEDFEVNSEIFEIFSKIKSETK